MKLNYKILSAFLGCSLILFGTLMSGCSDADSKPSRQNSTSKTLMVVASNYPVYYLAQKIGKDLIEVQYPVPADIDPAYWKPDTEAITVMQNADLVLLNGAGYESWLDTVTLDDQKLIDTSGAFLDQLIEDNEAVVHSHGPEGKHAHGGLAFTLWLDPMLYQLQARAVGSALAKLLPEQSDKFQANLDELLLNLGELDSMLDAFSVSYKQQPLLASHPVYQYLERRCALNLKSVHWEPDATPDETAWAELDVLLEQHPAKWMLWEDEPTAETRNALEMRGISLIILPPCGNVPDTEDFLSVLRRGFEALSRINIPQNANPENGANERNLRNGLPLV